ncbi:hypothetical protein [Thermoanaerobacter mathranii]|uniref:hypothetical protein n=1 Tax=Thermoanaerobacter mathranii TaxID=583357 RepID=UPI003D6B522E
MKVKDFIEKHQLNEIFELALRELNGEIPYLLLPIVNENYQIDKEYIHFYNMLKTLHPDENIKGKITVTFFFDTALDCENSKNERLEFLSWEEVLALDIVMPEQYSSLDFLLFVSELLYRITMYGRAFDKETKNRLIYEEKIKESLIPKMDSSKEKFIKAVKGAAVLFDSPLSIVPLGLGLTLVILILARYSFFFANLFASLIDTNLNTLPIKLLFSLFVVSVSLAASWLNTWTKDYLDRTFKMKLKENIKNYLEEHPEAASFLSTERFESLDYYFSKL